MIFKTYPRRRRRSSILLRALPLLLVSGLPPLSAAGATLVPASQVKGGAACPSYEYEARIGSTLYTCRPQGKTRVWVRTGTTKNLTAERLTHVLVPAISISQFGLSSKDVAGAYLGALATSKTVTTFVWLTKPLAKGTVAEPVVRARYESVRAMLASRGWKSAGLLRRPDDSDPIAFDGGAVFEKTEFSLTEGFSKDGKSLVVFVVGSDYDGGFQNEVRIAFGRKIVVSKFQPRPGITSIVPPSSRLIGVTCEAPDPQGVTKISGQYELSGGSYEVYRLGDLEYRYDGPTVRETALYFASESRGVESVRLVYAPTMLIAFTYDGKVTQQKYTYTPAVSRSMCP